MGIWNRNKLKKPVDWRETTKDPRTSSSYESVVHRIKLHFF
jgi:hypothetical protein